jgi:hypothetical protein
MIAELLKYKHYLLILMALLLANYTVMPMVEWSENQQSNLLLIEKQFNKTQSLLDNKDLLTEKLFLSKHELLKVKELVYLESSVDKFKLKVQSVIESVLASGKCETERIGFNGNVVVNAKIQRWLMEVRFKGDINCLTKATREIESLSPYIKIVTYNLNHRGLTEEVTGKLNARMNLNVWYKEIE